MEGANGSERGLVKPLEGALRLEPGIAPLERGLPHEKSLWSLYPFHKNEKSATILHMNNEMKKVDETTLENLLYLSRLSPESTDMATLKKQVDDIVGYFDILSKYDDSENPYDAYPTTEAEKLREDEVVPGLEMHDVKKVNAENFLDGYFQVPKVLGEGA